jgi:hypothetical protein
MFRVFDSAVGAQPEVRGRLLLPLLELTLSRVFVGLNKREEMLGFVCTLSLPIRPVDARSG